MKTAIYIEDGIVQLVITPESEFEKNAISMFNDKPIGAHLFKGSFYDCRGGWIRQNTYIKNDGLHGYGNPHNPKDNSLMIRVNETPEKPQ